MIHRNPDVAVIDQGSLVLIHPITDAAKDWVADRVEVPDYMWTGPMFACEWRYAADILERMRDAGLTVAV